MARFRLEIEYEGTRYSGWQVQRNARTVQGELLRVLEEAFPRRDCDIQGSGRTDAGVHARAQTAHLELGPGRDRSPSPDVIRMRLNDLLPPDINVLKVRPVGPAFHARHTATARSYLYQISRRRTAFGKRFVWWVKDRLQVERMQEGGASPPGDCTTSARSLRSARGTRARGSRCRRCASSPTGTWCWCAWWRRTSSGRWCARWWAPWWRWDEATWGREQVEGFLRAPSPIPARHTCPPSGLFLERVFYPGDDVDSELATLQPFFSIESW